MKLNKFVLVFLAVVSTLFILPTSAEELPAIDIVQLEDGSVRVSSDNEAIISGFVSLTFTNEANEVVLLPKDVTAAGNAFIFANPRLDGAFDFVFVYSEEGSDVAIPGSMVLTFIEKAEEEVGFSDTPLTGVSTYPYIYCRALTNKFIFFVQTEFPGDKFEVYYSTKKNGKYKKVTEYDSGELGYYNPNEGEWYYHSYWSGYINKTKVGKKYWIKARSYTEVAGQKEYSPWAKSCEFVKVGPIKNIVAKLIAPNTLNISWSKAKKAKVYDIDVYGYLSGTKAAYDAWILGGNDPVDFNWLDYYVKIGWRHDTKLRNANFRFSDGIDMDVSMKVDMSLYNGYFYQHSVIIDDEFCKPVVITNLSVNPSGKEVTFMFTPGVDISKYDLKRYGHNGVFEISSKSTDTGNLDKAAKIEKTTKITEEDGATLDNVVATWGEFDACLYDFNLFVATKPDGAYKRVETKADFSDPTHLQLTYKPKKGKTLYYKILPTVENIDLEAFKFPVLYDATDVSYYVNLVQPAEIIGFKLPK